MRRKTEKNYIIVINVFCIYNYYDSRKILVRFVEQVYMSHSFENIAGYMNTNFDCTYLHET